jgi:hypothetical protein
VTDRSLNVGVAMRGKTLEKPPNKQLLRAFFAKQSVYISAVRDAAIPLYCSTLFIMRNNRQDPVRSAL